MARGREKTCLQGDMDRLSELPDALILQILSLMEMKDIVKTGILSKRWKNLWSNVDRIVYKFRYGDVKRLPNEKVCDWIVRSMETNISFVNTTLRQHESNIKVFVLRLYILLEANRYAVMGDWICCVLEKKVEVLKLSGDKTFNYNLPDCLFQSSSLTELKLKHLGLPKLSLAVKWKLLKSLCLSYIWLNDESMENMLLGSSVLESLALEYVDGLERINIISPSVLKLKLCGIWSGDSAEYDPNVILKIRAPWLQELEISGRFPVTECQIEDLSSLVKANLTFTAFDKPFSDDEDVSAEMEFTAKWIDMVPHVLKVISHVTQLMIGTELIQAQSPFDQTRFFGDEDMDLTLLNWNFLHLKNVKIDYHRNPCFDILSILTGSAMTLKL